jgi:hypothetical protein
MNYRLPADLSFQRQTWGEYQSEVKEEAMLAWPGDMSGGTLPMAAVGD